MLIVAVMVAIVTEQERSTRKRATIVSPVVACNVLLYFLLVLLVIILTFLDFLCCIMFLTFRGLSQSQSCLAVIGCLIR